MDVKYLLVAGAAFGAGYYVARRRLEKNYFTTLARETDEARVFYREKYKKQAAKNGEDTGVTQAAIEAAEAMARYSGINVPPSVLTQEMESAVARDPELSKPAETDAWDQSAAYHEVEKNGEVAAYYADPDYVDPDDSEPEFVHDEPLPPLSEEERKARQDFMNEIKGQTVHDNGGTQAAVAQTVPVQYHRIATPEKERKNDSSVNLPPPVEITQQQFIDNEFGYKQFSFTYFLTDDVLANESDESMAQEARVASLGAELLEDLKVGGLDTIYVRNGMAKWEFEITRSAGSYADEVLNA